MAAWIYGWRTFTNLIGLVVVLYVLSEIHEKPASVIVPILGLIYISVRGVAAAQVLSITGIAAELSDIRATVTKLAYPEYERDPDEVAEARKTIKSKNIVAVIDGCFFSVITLACMWKLFEALGSWP